jgi:hypothetical protein
VRDGSERRIPARLCHIIIELLSSSSMDEEDGVVV